MLFFILKIEHEWIASNFFACTLKWKAPCGLHCVGTVSAGNAPSSVQQEACYRFCLVQKPSENRMRMALWANFRMQFSVKMQGHIWAGEHVLGQQMTHVYFCLWKRLCKGAGLAGWQQEAAACCALLSEQGANTVRDSLSRALHEQRVVLRVLQRSAFVWVSHLWGQQ